VYLLYNYLSHTWSLQMSPEHYPLLQLTHNALLVWSMAVQLSAAPLQPQAASLPELGLRVSLSAVQLCYWSGDCC
jgi:hypothetical protein